MSSSEWPELPGQGPGPGGGSDSAQQQVPKSYSGIAAINKSIRDNKNVLEVRLEKSENARFFLSNIEIEGLLTKLGIDSSHFTGVSSCPEGKGVVYITLHPSVNINRFLHKNEAYVLKDGVQTSIIRPAGKKEVSVLVSGLHPNTKDQAVIRYLASHGKVSPSDPAIHHVYPGRPGTSLLAGKLNGNRSYMVEISKHMGSYHIIDGEKVSIRYRGQTRTCARCHQFETQCPGKAVAKECTAQRVLLSTHMQEHWKTVSYVPDKDSSNSDDIEVEQAVDIQIGSKAKDTGGPDLTMRYNSVNIHGFLPGTDLQLVHDVLVEHGLPPEFSVNDIFRRENAGKLTIGNLSSETCISLMDRLHGKIFLKRKIFVTAVVAASPQKSAARPNPTMSPSKRNVNSDSVPSNVSTKPSITENMDSSTAFLTKTLQSEGTGNSQPPATESLSSGVTSSASVSQSWSTAPSAPDTKLSSSSVTPTKSSPVEPPATTPASICSDSSSGSAATTTTSNATMDPGIKEKVDIFDNKEDHNKDKRKAEGSPELTKIEKKKLKDAKKAQKRQEFREKSQLSFNQD